MDKLHIIWRDIERDEWEKIINILPRCNLYQDWDYAIAAAFANNKKLGSSIKIHRAIIYRNKTAIGIIQGFEKRYLFGFKLVRFIRGPLFINKASAKERLRIYSGLKKSCRILKGQMAVIIPELRHNDTVEDDLKSINLHRILTGMVTSWLDLSPSCAKILANFSKSWRRDINQCQKHDIAINFDGSLDAIIANNINDGSQKKYHRDNDLIYRQLPKDKLLITEAIKDGEIIAAALFIKHGNCATYQIGWSGDDGRKLNAQKILIWHSIQRLKEDDVKWLDLGAMDKKSAAAIMRFKQGMGGDKYTLSGTYI